MKKYFKILAFTLALVIAFGTMGVFAAGAEGESEYVQPEKFIYGDVDLDGSVTVKDATLIQKFIANLSTFNLTQRYLSDVTGLGITVRSATSIQKYLAKINTPNSKSGAIADMSNPITFDYVTESENTIKGDNILVDYSNYIEFSLSSESGEYFSKHPLCIFTSNHFSLYDLYDTELKNKYTDKYFEENALIVLSFLGSSSKGYRADSIVANNGEIGINYTMLFPNGGAVNADVANSRIYMEVRKTDIKEILNVTSYQSVELY